MSHSKSISRFLWFFLIPIITAGIWTYYYGIDRHSNIELLKILIPAHIGIFLVGEFLIWAILPGLSNSFRFGFWLGLFLITPFYIWQISFQFNPILGNLSPTMLYIVYGMVALISSIAVGLIIWAVYELVVEVRNKPNSAKVAIIRLLIAIICLAVLFPVFGKNRAAQPQLVKQRISYRAFQKRDLPQPPLHNVIVLGIDGGDWQVIEPLVDQGKMPNMKKLMSEGKWGTLESERPMRSPSLWTTMFTSQPSDVHGISDWNISYSKNRLVKAVWNILSEYDLRTTMINVPATFPPEEVVGKLISGFPYPNQTLNTYGWLCSTEPVHTTYTPNLTLDMKLQQDGSYSGKLVVNDVLMDKYNAGMRGKVFKNIGIEIAKRTKQGVVYGKEIVVANIRYNENEDVAKVYSVKGENLLATLSPANRHSDFFQVQLDPGVVAKTRVSLVEMDKKGFKIYVAPFSSMSDKPRYEYTFPTALAKDITNLVGHYIVEMTWIGAKDFILLPTIKNLLNHAEDVKTKVGKILFDEREWDMFIQVFSLTDRLQHPTWAFRYDEVPVSKLDSSVNVDMIQDEGEKAIEEAYVKCDKWLGLILENVKNREDIIIIASDHGFQLGTNMEAGFGVHRIEGMYLVWGGPVLPENKSDFKANRAEDKAIIDVAKNILYLMGLSIAEDMGGNLWLDLYDPDFVEENKPSLIATYNVEEEVKGTMQEVDRSTLEQLRGLGYLDGAANLEGN